MGSIGGSGNGSGESFRYVSRAGGYGVVRCEGK